MRGELRATHTLQAPASRRHASPCSQGDALRGEPRPAHPTPSPSASPTHRSDTKQKQTLHNYVRFGPHPALQPGPRGVGVGVGISGGLALEPQLLVLGGDVVPEQLQGLLHGLLRVSPEVPAELALQNLDDGVRDELQGEGERGRSLGRAGRRAGIRPSRLLLQGHLSSTHYTLAPLSGLHRLTPRLPMTRGRGGWGN